MKTENTIGLVGLVAVIGLVAFFSAKYDSFVVLAPTANSSVANTSVGTTNTTSPISSVPIVDVAAHSTVADCWIVVRGKVYDVTRYLAQHPGGAARITPFCGADATTAFMTKGGQGTHSAIAESELAKLYVGEAQTSATVPSANSNGNVNSGVFTNTSPTSVSTKPSTASSVTLDAGTVAKHNRASDCWIIVNKGVYAVTGYLAKHPGGASRITPYCGSDATTAFATRGGNGTHSSSASADLAALRLGTLGSSTTTKVITQVNANVTTLSPQRGEREDEDDD